jgi:hypothetical protein
MDASTASVLPIPPLSSKVPHPDEFNPYWAYIGGGFFFCTVVHYLSQYTTPASVATNYRRSWKWRNIATSLVHSSITAVWAPLGFYLHPDMCDYLVYAFNDCTHMLISFSMGYFIYDFIDMYLYNQRNGQKNTYELLLHHLCAIVCFGIASHTRTMLPFASLALVVEVNSVFLHIRQLLSFAGISRQTTLYRNIALLNVATFVLFRIVLMCWMVRWLTINKDTLPTLFLSAGGIGISTLLAMNAMLFYRVLNRDFFCSTVESADSSKAVDNSDSESDDVVLLAKKDRVAAFHPVSQDVNRMMKNFFDGDAAASIDDNSGFSAKEALSKKEN